MNQNERYKLNCWRCGREVEIQAGAANQPESRECPHCGTRLVLEWRPELAA
jgi:DNA-directed RNA polymerase subunit RPC12/RpoP